MYHSQLLSQDFYPLSTEHLIAQFPVAPSEEERQKTKAVSSSGSMKHQNSHKTERFLA
jgi:hypothetical protein